MRPPPCIPAALTRQLSNFPTNRKADKPTNRKVGKLAPHPTLASLPPLPRGKRRTPRSLVEVIAPCTDSTMQSLQTAITRTLCSPTRRPPHPAPPPYIRCARFPSPLPLYPGVNCSPTPCTHQQTRGAARPCYARLLDPPSRNAAKRPTRFSPLPPGKPALAWHPALIAQCNHCKLLSHPPCIRTLHLLLTRRRTLHPRNPPRTPRHSHPLQHYHRTPACARRSPYPFLLPRGKPPFHTFQSTAYPACIPPASTAPSARPPARRIVPVHHTPRRSPSYPAGRLFSRPPPAPAGENRAPPFLQLSRSLLLPPASTAPPARSPAEPPEPSHPHPCALAATPPCTHTTRHQVRRAAGEPSPPRSAANPPTPPFPLPRR